MAPLSPAVARWELSLRLRRRASELGLEVAAITSALKFSRNYWSAVVNDRAVLTEEKLRTVIDLLDFGHEEADQLLALRDLAKERSWLNRYSAVITDDDVNRFYGLEMGAERVQAWESMLVTGLLQTEDYARAVIGTDPNVTATRATQLVQVRLLRQQRLRADQPLHLQAVMSEAALCQQTGGPEVLRDQLTHLHRMAEELEHVEIRIVPFTAPTLGSLGGATRFVFHFASARLPALAWAEHTATMERAEEGDVRFEQMSISHARALDMSLGRDDSLALIKQRLADIP